MTLAALWPSAGGAAEATFRLDPNALVNEFQPGKEIVYKFPETAHLRVQFGAASGNVIPVTVPIGGLQLGVARAKGAPPLEFRLAEPASGTLRRTAAGVGILELRAPVLVNRLGGLRAVRYDLELSAQVSSSPPGEKTAAGRAEMMTSDDVKSEGGPAGTFYAVISGSFDQLPEELK
jgi:hypothetical protein